MNLWLLNILSVLVLCIISAGFLIPQILLIAFRKKLFDDVGGRKIHKGAIPRLGGIAFKPVIFFSIGLILAINLILGNGNIFEGIGPELPALALGYCSITILYLVGIADDLIGVRYRAKFIVQFICAIMIISGGLWINNLHGLFGLKELPFWIGYPLTVLVITLIINAINLIDGIDGLASGLCSVASVAYTYIFYTHEQYIYALISAATLGVLIPFFYYNVFGDADKQTKIFMGDTGSLTIGMILCFLSLKLVQMPSTVCSENQLVIAFAPMIIPCFDVVRVFFHRIRNGHNPFLPDKSHIHHKLLAVGMRQKSAMATIVIVALIFTLANIYVSKYININILLLFDILFVTIPNIWLSGKIKKLKGNIVD